MWFTTNTIISAKKRARLKKEEYVKGKKRSRIHRCSHGVSPGRARRLLQVAAEAELEEFLEQWELVRNLKDGFRESSESWKEVLRILAERGLNAPLLAIGDRALGSWPALREIFPTTKEQRYWQHKTLNVLNDLPKSLQARTKSQLREIWNAENRKEARKAFQAFVRNYGDKYPKAAQCLKKDEKTLLPFYDFPRPVSIRTTNPIESTFATIRHRTDRARGCFSRESLLALVFQGGDVGGEKVPANKSVEVYFVSVSYLCAIRFFGFSGSALSCL